MRSRLRGDSLYPGSSKEKGVTRLALVSRMKEILGPRRFKKGLHLVLTGDEAGDVPTYLSRGAPLQSIVGVEWRPEYAAAARRHYPDLIIHKKDVRDALYHVRGSLESAYLDFCGIASQKNLNVASQASEIGLRPGGVVAIAAYASRDSLIPGILDLSARCHREVPKDLMPASFARAEYITKQIEMRDCGLHATDWFFYRGISDHPMVVVLLRKGPSMGDVVVHT